MRPGRKPALGYTFTPTCKRALRALAEGSLDTADYVLLAFFYDRMSYATRQVSVTLPQMVAGTRWQTSEDALYRRLLRLKREHWLEYTSLPGRHRHSYLVTLLPNHEADAKTPEKRTEDDPSSERKHRPRRPRPQPRSQPRKNSTFNPPSSEETRDPDFPVGPSIRPSRPSSSTADKPATARDSVQGELFPRPTSSDVQS